ncbi:MAG: hypothetical protein AAGA21_16800 [Pseudomonadota bacterium]
MLDLNLQPLEMLDLEQKSNGREKLIHIMWKRWARQNRAGPVTIRRS